MVFSSPSDLPHQTQERDIISVIDQEYRELFGNSYVVRRIQNSRSSWTVRSRLITAMACSLHSVRGKGSSYGRRYRMRAAAMGKKKLRNTYRDASRNLFEPASRPEQRRVGPLSTIMGCFKAAVTRHINEKREELLKRE